MLALICAAMFTWGSAMANIPADVQAVMDKEAGGTQLTAPEKEILFNYLDQVQGGLPPSMDTEWGPDGWGYTAKDPASGGAPYNWYDITATGTEIWTGQNQDDTWSDWIQLPFTFPFYDGNFDSISISANVLIKFTTAYVSYSNAIPSSSYPWRIDPWVYDMYHLGTASHYYYQAFGDSLFVVSFIALWIFLAVV